MGILNVKQFHPKLHFDINIRKVKVIVALAPALFQILNFLSSDTDFCLNFFYPVAYAIWTQNGSNKTPKPLGPVFEHKMANHSYIMCLH